jgi:hypothetical protein
VSRGRGVGEDVAVERVATEDEVEVKSRRTETRILMCGTPVA